MKRWTRKDADDGERFTYTKILDIVASQFGLTTAAVYGVVHRHCQMRDGVCRASIRRMAGLIGLSSTTMVRHLHELVKAGYLEDLTPNQRNKPHIYRDAFLSSPGAGSAADKDASE